MRDTMKKVTTDQKTDIQWETVGTRGQYTLLMQVMSRSLVTGHATVLHPRKRFRNN